MPVLPATWYPGTAAVGPVPRWLWTSCVTAVSIVRRVAAVCGETTCTPAGVGMSVRTPSEPVVDSTIRGGIRNPLFATAWYMPAICSTVMERPWPIGRLPNVEPDQLAIGGTSPALSPGSPTPVRTPSP